MVDTCYSVRRYQERPRTVIMEQGEGPTIVFAHGMLMDRTMFTAQHSALSDTYHTISYDLRARTDQYKGRYDLYSLADDLNALLSALEIKSIILAGVSMGGFMALRFADRYPEKVEGLILINSMAASHSQDEQEEYKDIAAQIQEKGINSKSMLDVSQAKMFGETTLKENSSLVEYWTDRWRTYPAESVYNAMHSWIDRKSFLDKLYNITTPVLMIHGEEDNVLIPERTESTLERLPNARLAVVPRAGHSAPIEQPEQVNHVLRKFLSDIST